MKFWFSTFCIYLFFNVLGLTQNTIGLPQIINYDKNQFRGGPQTWDIQQDHLGVMYFANNDGLLTFDGNYWRMHVLPNKTIVRSLAISNDGKIFVGGQNEFGYFMANQKGFLEYISLTQLIPKEQNQFADVWDVELFNEGVFFRTMDRIFEYKNNKIQIFHPKSEWQFLKTVNHKLYAQDKESGLFEYKQNTWQPIQAVNQQTTNFIITNIISISTDTLLIITLKNGLYYFVNNAIVKKESDLDNGVKNNSLFASVQLNKQECVVGSNTKGCLIIDLKGKIIQTIDREEGLQNNDVLTLFLDKDKNLWAGLNNGISFIAYNSAIKYIRPSKKNILAGYSATIFKNQLFLATSNGVYATALKEKKEDLSFTKSNFVEINNSEGQVWSLKSINEELLICHNDGVFVLKNNMATPILKHTGSWVCVPTTSVFPTPNILIGTYTGIFQMDFLNKQFNKQTKLEGPSESLRFLTIDNDNTIWASHPYLGVYKLEIKPDKKSYFYTLYTQKDGLPSTLDNYVYKIKNRIVFATVDGIYEFDAKNQKFVPSSFLYETLKKTEIQFLTEDLDGNIWFMNKTQVGIAKYSPNNKDTPYQKIYFAELSNKFLTKFQNLYPYNSKNIFIGVENGMVHLNYEKYLSRQIKLKVMLSQVKQIENTDSIIFGGYVIPSQRLDEKNTNTQIPIFTSSKKTLRFEYTSSNYENSDAIEFSYQLLGYDENWSAWTTKTEKEYTNLTDKKYIFNIKARDNIGNESEIVSYVFIISPPWYKTIWAYGLYILLLVLLVRLQHQWQKKKLHNQRIKFEKEQERLKYIHQLELEKHEKEIIKLQNEKLENDIVLKNKELANASMHLVERQDVLNKIKHELQNLYNKTEKTVQIKNILALLNESEKNNENWQQFASHFDEINDGFLQKLKNKFPILSQTDLKMCAYLKLNLSSKEISQLLNISVRGVEISRYRLRKKFQIDKDVSLVEFLQKFN